MIKKILLVIGGIVLILIGIVGFILWRLDPEELGQEVIRRVNDKGGVQLEAETFSIKPLQGLFIDQASISGETPSGSVRADVAEVIIEYELMPILQKELVINRIIIDQPQAELISRPAAKPVPEGESAEPEVAVEEPAETEATLAEQPEEAVGGFKPTVVIEEVRIENASLTAKTEGGDGGELAIKGLGLELHDFYVDSAVVAPLLGLNARGGIRIEEIQADDTTIHGGRGDIGIHNGQIAISDLGVETPNASLNVAALDLDMRQDPPSYHLEAGGAFDLNAFVEAEGPGGFGPAAVSLALDGAGPDPDGATGGGSLRMEAGTVPAFPAVAKIEKLLGKPLISGTPYQVTDMDFSLANGIATLEPFRLVLENLQIGGWGTINLDGPVNLVVEVRLPREQVDIKALEGLIDGMTDEEGWTIVPFTVGGNIGEPDVSIDMTAAKEAAKGAAKDAAGKAVDKAVDKVEDKVKGLFKKDKDDG